MPRWCLCPDHYGTLRPWWYLLLPDFNIERTLFHLKNNKDETFILILLGICHNSNKLLRGSYCHLWEWHHRWSSSSGSLCNGQHQRQELDDTHLQKVNYWTSPGKILLWTPACSDVGINATWISTVANKIADEILRIKNLLTILSLFNTTLQNFNRIMRNWDIVVSSNQVTNCSQWIGTFYWRETRQT